MISECSVINQPDQPVLSIRTHTPVEKLPMLIGDAYSRIGRYLEELHEPICGMPFVAYYTLDMQNLDVEIGFPIAKLLPARGDITAHIKPAERSATCLYTGPYEEMVPAYDALSKWMNENRLEPTGVAIEYYLNSPAEVSVQELQTQIEFPLKN